VGEKIDHLCGMTIEDAEHQLATRLYQNNSRVHFDHHEQVQSRFGRRLVYGGHIISLARALSFDGLENAFHVAGINAGRHVSPAFASDTVYAWSEVLEKASLDRPDAGALRLRLVALRDKAASSFALKTEDQYDPAVLLDLDLWVLMPL
jgi:2-methylfumaryl-CoA hydratase